jgi:hypothetical protein
MTVISRGRDVYITGPPGFSLTDADLRLSFHLPVGEGAGLTAFRSKKGLYDMTVRLFLEL